MSDEKKNSTDELSILFPSDKVLVGDRTITITPITLKDLPRVVKAFSTVMRLTENPDTPPSDVAVEGMTELLELIPFCIDCDPEKVPVTALPDILDKILDQNFNTPALEKWTALVQKVTDRLPEGLLEYGKGSQSVVSEQ